MSQLESLIKLTESEIPDKGIYKVTQFLHDSVGKLIPENLDNVSARVMIEGFGGAYLLTRGLQWLSKNVVDKYVLPEFDDKALPILERVCEYGIPIAVGLYALFDQEGAKEFIYSKPMDNWGIAWAYLGGVVATEQDLRKRQKLKSASSNEN